MPETPTPGEIAYTAYMRKVHGCCPWPWRAVLEASKAGWEAAAQGVRDAYKGELAAAWHQGQEEERSRE